MPLLSGICCTNVALVHPEKNKPHASCGRPGVRAIRKEGGGKNEITGVVIRWFPLGGGAGAPYA